MFASILYAKTPSSGRNEHEPAWRIYWFVGIPVRGLPFTPLAQLAISKMRRLSTLHTVKIHPKKIIWTHTRVDWVCSGMTANTRHSARSQIFQNYYLNQGHWKHASDGQSWTPGERLTLIGRTITIIVLVLDRYARWHLHEKSTCAKMDSRNLCSSHYSLCLLNKSIFY